MKDKIKRFIEEIQTRMMYNHCYSSMEYSGIAVFGMCSGKDSLAYRKEKCSSCPYFRVVTTMPDKKLTDNEIIMARETLLKEQIKHYNERLKETLDSYYRRKKDKGTEDTLEICVLRESAVLISKLESIINRLQAENEDLKTENLILSQKRFNIFERIEFTDKLKKQFKAEGYKEFAERLKERPTADKDVQYVFELKINSLLKELVGDK